MRQGVALTGLLLIVGLPTVYIGEGGWDGISRDVARFLGHRPIASAPSPGRPRTPDNPVRDSMVVGALAAAMTFAQGAGNMAQPAQPGSTTNLAAPPRRPIAAEADGLDLAGELLAAKQAARSAAMAIASLADPTDYGSALKRYALAADPGDADLRYAIALEYLDGQAPDYPQAMRWLRSAADMGQVSAALVLCDLYAAGRGIEQNYAVAYFWASIATRTPGDAGPARERLDRLLPAMTPAERTAADVLLREREGASVPAGTATALAALPPDDG